MTAIYKRELKSYFRSMTGYVFIAFFIFFLGIYYMAYNIHGGYPYFSYTLQGTMIILLIAVPVLTMRSLADERKTKTDQLLFTSPVSVWQIVWGKFLSMATVFLIPMLIACVCPLIIRMNGTAYLAEDYASILAFFLMGCIYIAIGLFISSLTESQIIASVGTFCAILLITLWPGLVGFAPVSALGSLTGFLMIWTFFSFAVYRVTSHKAVALGMECAGILALTGTYLYKKSLFDYALVHLLKRITFSEIFDNFANNHIFDLGGLAYYLSVIFLFLFLTVQSIEKRRWS